MTHIKEKDIIPLLDIVKSEYTKRIVEESPQTIKQDEKIEEALTQAMELLWIWSKAEKRTAKKKGCKKWKRN